MSSVQHSLNELSSFEKFSLRKSAVHDLHPAVKIIAALFFIVLLVSFERHAISAMLPFMLYIFVLAPLAGVPLGFLFKRALIAVPFVFFAGVANVFFERQAAFYIGGIKFDTGFVSLCSLILRAVLCVSCVLLLAATTPLADIFAQLRRFKVPAIFVMLLEMTVRYIGVLAPEAQEMHIAYHLRGGTHRRGHPEHKNDKNKGVNIRHYGAFIGSFFLRTVNRGERVYAAMKCRGYSIHSVQKSKRRVRGRDMAFLFSVCTLCILFRFFDVPLLIGSAMETVLKGVR